jgi:PAS domain S-box-containing protein
MENDEEKTKKELIDELTKMRQQTAAGLGASGAARERAEEVLRQSEMMFSVLFGSASEAIVIVNESGSILLVNARAEKMFGYSQDELLGQRVEVLLPEHFRGAHIGHRAGYLSEPRARPMGLGLDLAGRRKDGTEFPVEISLSFVETEDGLLVMSLITDITMRKQAEEELKKSEERYRSLVETAGSVIVCLSPDGRILEWNHEAERVYGWGRREVLGKDYFELFLPEAVRDAVAANIKKVLAGEPTRGFENAVLTRGGDERVLLWNATRLMDAQGQPTAVIAVGQDITEHKKAEEQSRLQQRKLIQVDKMSTLGILVSGVAHEINNPNNYILLNARIFSKVWNDVMPILREYYEKNGDFALAGMPYTKAHEKIGQLISGISEGAMRIQKIVQGLKDFARQDRDDLNQPVDMNSVIESAIVIINNLISKSTDHFSVNYGENLPKIMGNFQQLEQVVINLITNSCQALQSAEKSILVSASYDGLSDSVLVKVSDEGEGISPENLKRIFDPFFTTKRDSGGTGLGLSVSYNIAKNHGGDLSFTSEVGKGTTAVLTLPVNHKLSAVERKE